MTEKEKHRLSTSPFSSDLYVPWLTTMKHMIASSLDTNEKLTKEALDRYADSMAWAKDTPWAPMYKAFITFTSKMLEGSTSLVRMVWQLDKIKDGSEEMQKT